MVPAAARCGTFQTLPKLCIGMVRQQAEPVQLRVHAALWTVHAGPADSQRLCTCTHFVSNALRCSWTPDRTSTSLLGCRSISNLAVIFRKHPSSMILVLLRVLSASKECCCPAIWAHVAHAAHAAVCCSVLRYTQWKSMQAHRECMHRP